jgi:hypothetical protein
MADHSLPAILEHVQRRLRPSLSGVVTDAQLLERFLQDRDEAAFELLMWRHGSMVWGVCRRVLVKEGETTQHYRNHRASLVWAQRDRVWVLVYSQDTIVPGGE